MIFTSEGSQLVEIQEVGDQIKFIWGQDVADHRNMCYQLRTHDEDNGMSTEGHFQHVASMDECTLGVLMTTRPEVLRDSKELDKWLRTDVVGQACRVARDAKPIRGDSLQLITRPGYRYK